MEESEIHGGKLFNLKVKFNVHCNVDTTLHPGNIGTMLITDASVC